MGNAGKHARSREGVRIVLVPAPTYSSVRGFLWVA